jgi:hypothetical protein
VSLDAGLLEKLEVVDRCLEICLADTVDLKTYGVLSGIENAVFAGAIVLEFQHYVSIVKLVNVFGFSFV